MNASKLSRRRSYDTSQDEVNKLVKGFPRRCSLSSSQMNPLPRRRSEVTLFEIQEVQKIEENKKSVLRRQYSTICMPKIVSERQTVGKTEKKISTSKKEDDFELPRIPSVTPEPEEIKYAEEGKDSEKIEDELKHGVYRPKHCWCFRCQLMYSMFKAGDDRLSVWGNYPCFRR